MNPRLAGVLRKGWKCLLLVVWLAAIVYKVNFAAVRSRPSRWQWRSSLGSNGHRNARGPLSATVSASFKGSSSSFWRIKTTGQKSGQLLARLDDSDLKREVTAQEAVLNATEATVERVIAMKQGQGPYLNKPS